MSDALITVLAGVLVGFAAVIPIGPMSMTVIGVATHQGRVAGAQAAAGVVGGDVVSAGSAAALALVGTRLPDGVFATVQVLALALLVAVGLMLVTRTERMGALAADLRRPGAVLFTLTAVSPVTLGSWLAILLASPFVHNPARLLAFALGIVVASGLWHPALAVGAAAVGPRLAAPTLQRLARFGGLCMIGLAAVLLLAR